MRPKDEFTFTRANDLLVEYLPELKNAAEATLEYMSDPPAGPHTLYDEALNPYIGKLLDTALSTDEALQRVFEFIEHMSSSPDRQLRDVVAATILASLVDDPRMELARRYMGPATRRILREVLKR
jgi:hypothetical protein